MWGWSDFIELLFPRYCRVCGHRLTQSEEELCLTCLRHLPRALCHGEKENEIEKLFWGLIPIERGTSFFVYRKGSDYSRLIYHLKYYHHPQTGHFLARHAATELQPLGFFDGIDVIVPVPLSKKRKRQRGYNQSELIAQGLSVVTGIPVESRCLIRRKANESQTHKGREERWENVKEIFALQHPDLLQGKHLLLVDDVLTTGATLCACGHEILRSANGVRISIFTLAHGSRSNM